ncbi:CTP synthetase [Roseovarius amoyensis]|uniref:CTP synthetase n=1 Tax=Roseovarius amoyensis TaxID=2211448 RepID=UPI000DBE7A8F|nr:CTP synthetase [Roseovarius amoyensis]
MLWLFLILHLFIGTTLAGSSMIAALTMGYDTMTHILIAAGIGFVIAFPVSWLVSKRLYDLR